MKANSKSVSLFAAVFLVVGLGAPDSRGDMTITLSNSHGNGSGGEFLATPMNFGFEPASLGQDPGEFEVFCVERNEYINFVDTFYVVINDGAIKGGRGGGNPDPLGARTAFLYDQFITQQLGAVGYDYGTGSLRRKSANALQNTIWYLEDELDHKYHGLYTQYERDLVDAFLAHAVDNVASNSHDIGDVRIMNLYADPGRTVDAQDQLVKIPAPGGLLLGVIGLALVRKAGR